jgi:hypothetical protein
MTKIIRTFHPVGQGAFYSERHDDFNVVYDCGTEYKNRFNKGIEQTIKTAFSKNDEIDILFISHFDFDHVSKISTLKSSVKRIKNVILPLLHDDTKRLLTSFYNGMGATDIANLISNPEEFFGDETTIISVTLAENNETLIDDNLENIEFDSLSTKQHIKSGDKIKKTINNYEWIYIPYNHDYKNGNSDLEIKLENAGFDIHKMKNDTNYILNMSITKQKELKKIYDSLAGKINQNSTVVYSGIINSTNENFRLYGLIHNLCCMDDYFHHRFWSHHIYENRVSCIYTGDTNLNIVKIKSIFSQYWDIIGLIQVPHHGDIKSFNTDVLDTPKLCPISVGKNNSYGHPSDKVIIDILSNDSCPIFVTEDKNSIFIQIIELFR